MYQRHPSPGAKFFSLAVLLSFFLLFIGLPELALAQEAAAAPGQPRSFSEVMSRTLPMFFIVFFIFYFLVIRPQDKKLRDQQNLLKNLKKGDQVATSSGIIGRVAGIENDHILLEIAKNVRVKVLPANIEKPFTSKAESSGEKKQKKSAA